MAELKELLYIGTDETINFGNHLLESKAKLDDFEFRGNLWKVKTFKTMTRLEKNGMLVYESVPGTTVSDFRESEAGLSFTVIGNEDAQITVGLEESTEYEVAIGDDTVGRMATNMSGKLTLSVELTDGEPATLRIMR
ncbi:MAG: endosialidase [Lachnospiraceae bacterium]|jgi:hypothetical protein|nr:endosialidase [Lachnospiraceae bacterium]